MALAGIRLLAIDRRDQFIDDDFSGAIRHSHSLLISDLQLLLCMHTNSLTCLNRARIK